MKDNKDKLEALAQSLLDNEVIFKEDVERILGARPFGESPLLVESPLTKKEDEDASVQDSSVDASSVDASSADPEPSEDVADLDNPVA